MKILLDNGHGFDTPGKRSPDGHFREYAYNRYLAFLIRERITALGLDCEIIVPEYHEELEALIKDLELEFWGVEEVENDEKPP